MDRGHLFRFNLGSQLSSKSQVEIWGPGNKITAPRNSPAHKRTQQATYRTSGPHHLLGVLYCLGVLRYSEEPFLKASTVRSVNPAQGYRGIEGLGMRLTLQQLSMAPLLLGILLTGTGGRAPSRAAEATEGP